MCRKSLLMLFSLLALSGFLPVANAAALDTAYMTGKWEINADGACGKALSSHSQRSADYSSFLSGRNPAS